MKLLSIQRKLRILQRIYAFNFTLKGNNVYTNSDDIWLQIITKPHSILLTLLDQVIVFLILKDSNIAINGSAIEQLATIFGNKLVRKGFTLKLSEIIVPAFDLNWLQLKNWKEQLHYLILLKLYTNKPEAIRERIAQVLDYDNSNITNDVLEKYIAELRTADLEQIVLYFCKTPY